MKIQIENRKKQFELADDEAVVSYRTVDCTDCTIFKPSLFDEHWLSHKTNEPETRYEVMVSLAGNVSFQCGSNPDLSLFKSNLKQRLDHNEAVVADAVYNDSSYIYACGMDSELAQA